MDSVQRAAENVSIRNMNAVITHCNETREIVRNFEQIIQEYKNITTQQFSEIQILKSQISLLLAAKLNGGPTE